MRVALKVAYDGRSFYGHQRQPDRRTVEGECLTALRAARILHDARTAFFRSASRTDRGVSALGNVIAFDTSLRGPAVVGAFNDQARDVWAWAFAEVPDGFHPRHAVERWYRYTLLGEVSEAALQAAGSLFVGTHDLRSFCTDPPASPWTIREVTVTRVDASVLVDVRARSFRRGMVRRMIAAMLAVATGEATQDDLYAALAGTPRDFGSVPPEPLVLMDVSYGFDWQVLVKPKAAEEWADRRADLRLRLLWLDELRRVAGASLDP